MMDSLFVMQRYWGSDDEKEENNSNDNITDDNYTAPNKKLKSDIPVIKINSPDQLCKKQDLSFPVSNSHCENLNRNQEPESSVDETNNDIKTVNNVKSKKSKKNTPQEIENVETFCTIGQVHYQKDIKVKHSLPHWLSNPTYISVNLLEEETPISDLNFLDSNTKKNLIDVGVSFLFPVQLAVIPWLMQSKEQSLLIRPSDICVSAPTGSGKTLAFVLPIVQSLKDRVVCAIRALVVLPVNELAIQVYKVFETFVRGTDLKVALITGQKSFIVEQNALVKSNGEKIQNLVDIIVTTPGRLLDHIYRTKGFCLKRLRYLVIDEADRMMAEIQQGWLKKVEEAVFYDCSASKCNCSVKRISFEPSSAFNFGFISLPLQKLLYSATLTHDPEQLHSLLLYKPKLFTASSFISQQEYISRTCTIPAELTMLQVVCEEGMKPMIICHLIKQHGFKRVLCFTETVERAHRLHLVLEGMGLFQVREISSFNRVIQRKIVLEQFSSGKVDVLVCSDLVARGIDVKDIDCVISYDVPQVIKTYVHRIGRTARAGKTGTAITLLSKGEIPHFNKVLFSMGIKIPEKVIIDSENLKPLVDSYKTALSVTDAKLNIHQFPIPEGKSGQQAAELLQKRLETLGAVKTGTFCVECETYYAAPHVNINRAINIIHNSEHPVTTFALLDTGTCLMADSQFDMLMSKMGGIYIPKKATKIESKGPRYEVQDFIIKLGSVSIGPSFRGILVEVEYTPCVVPVTCWDLMRELLQGFVGNSVQCPSQYLQGKMNEIYTTVDTVQQYMEHFNSFRRAPSSAR